MCQGDSGRPRGHFGEGSGKVRGRFGGGSGAVRGRFGGGSGKPRGSQRQTPLWTCLWDSYNTFTRTL